MAENSGFGRLLAVLALGVFAGAVATRITDPLVAVLSVHFMAPPAEVALLASAYALPFALVQPILGPVGDALGKRRVITIALALLSVLLLAGAFAPTLWALIALRGLAGAAAGGVMPLSLALVGDSVPMQQRQVALSRLLVFAIGGQVVGGALGGLLEPLLGWRGVLAACGVIAVAAFLVMLLGNRGQPEAQHRFDLAVAVQRYRHLLTMRAALVLYASVAVEGALVFGSFPYFAPMLQARGLGGTAEAGLAVAAFGCGGLIYGLIAGPVLRRIGQGRMVMLGGAICLVALSTLALAPFAWLFIGGGLVLGTGFYMIHNSIQTRVTELTPATRGSAVSLHAFHFFIGQSLGPVFFGLALGQVGSAPALLAAALAILALGLLLGHGGPVENRG